jgi:hypothetical protein
VLLGPRLRFNDHQITAAASSASPHGYGATSEKEKSLFEKKKQSYCILLETIQIVINSASDENVFMPDIHRGAYLAVFPYFVTNNICLPVVFSV